MGAAKVGIGIVKDDCCLDRVDRVLDDLLQTRVEHPLGDITFLRDDEVCDLRPLWNITGLDSRDRCSRAMAGNESLSRLWANGEGVVSGSLRCVVGRGSSLRCVIERGSLRAGCVIEGTACACGGGLSSSRASWLNPCRFLQIM